MTSPQEVGSRGIWNFNTVRRRLPQSPPSRWRFLRHIRFGSCPQWCRDGRGRAQGNIWEVPKRLDFFGRKTLPNMNSLLGLAMIFKVFSMMKFGTRITEPQTRNEEYPKHWSKALQIGQLGFTIPMIKTGCFICEFNVVYLAFQLGIAIFGHGPERQWHWMAASDSVLVVGFKHFMILQPSQNSMVPNWHIFSMMIQQQRTCILLVYLHL